jgi:hypothetical protein
METRNNRLVSSAQLNGMRVESGDILRESVTKKTVKVLNVYETAEGEKLLMVEYNAPGNFGVPFLKPVDGFSFLS